MENFLGRKDTLNTPEEGSVAKYIFTQPFVLCYKRSAFPSTELGDGW